MEFESPPAGKEFANFYGEALEECLPRGLDKSWVKKLLGPIDLDLDLVNEFFSEPSWDFLDRSVVEGRWNSWIMMNSCLSVGGKLKDLKPLLPVSELLFASLMLISDVGNDTRYRFERASTHMTFGKGAALNSGFALTFLANELVLKSNLNVNKQRDVLDVINRYMLTLHLAKSVLYGWRKKPRDKIDEDEFFDIKRMSVGSVPRASAAIGCIVGNGTSEQRRALGRFAQTLGMGYRLRSELRRITNDGDKWNPTFGSDISSGKITYLVNYVLNVASEPNKARLSEILKLKTLDRKVLWEAVDILNKYNAKGYAYNIAINRLNNAANELKAKIPESEARGNLLKMVESLKVSLEPFKAG